MMVAEGQPAIFARHHALGEVARLRTHELGLALFADPAHASDTVTAIRLPNGMDGKALVAALREREAVVIGGGQDRLEGCIVRLGHMGYVSEPDIASAMDALGRQLAALGYLSPASMRADPAFAPATPGSSASE
jgi:aspartate aminotransferase-like enzyme